MKLTELEPRWSGFPSIITGVTFLCPHCKTQRLGVHFNPPIDPDGWWDKIARPTYIDINVWTRISGETFDTLTLTPSIDASESGRINFPGHWHGFITNGEVS